MTDAARKRLIEELLPLAEIGVESSKSVSNGDIHAIHTWFARRPLAACRAATFAALVDAPATEDERDALMKLIVESLPAAAPQKQPQVIDAMRSHILATFEGRPPRVLDPFAGGGSLPLEAARLGCETYAHDLNPNAVLTLLGTIDFPMRFADTRFPLPPRTEDTFDTILETDRTGTLTQAVAAWGDWVENQVKPRLEKFYRISRNSTVVAYFWAKTIHCTNPACKAEIPLIANRWLSKRDGKAPVAYHLAPQNDRTFRVEILTGDAAIADDPGTGTMAGGSVQCLFCPQTIAPTAVKEQFAENCDGRVLLAVAIRDDSDSSLIFASASEVDRNAYKEATRSLQAVESEYDDPFFPMLPDELFPEKGALGIRPSIYGVKIWRQMYNDRQLLALTLFVQAIKDAYQEMISSGMSTEMAKATSLYLAFSLSRLSIKMSESSRWYSDGHTIQAATAGHKLPMLWDYVEANPLSGATGSWGNMHSWSLPSLDRVLGASRIVSSVAWGDATKLHYEDNYFDAVLTDPPYYDSVPYSNLADMQYIWLHRALGEIMPDAFPSPLTPKKAEIVQDNSRHPDSRSAKAFFEERLQSAFAEINRVLRPDGVALIMYAHKASSAWETLVSALIRSGFQVTASWPVNTETMSRQVWLGGAVLQSTIFLVCRKRTGQRVAYLEEILADMHKAVQQALARFWAAGIGGADFFISAIGPALSVFSRFDEVRYSSGQRVSVANFLTLVRQAVVDFSLQQALQGVNLGEVDRETQFALLWRWTYGHAQVETGAALLLDKATGVELAELEKRGLIGRVDNNRRMVLYGPEERPGLVEQTFNRLRSGSVPLIDLIHCAALLWRDNRREELTELLAGQGDAMRKVAQALAEIQRNGHSERRLTLGFLGAWPAGLTMRAAPPPSRQAQIKEQQLAFDLDNPTEGDGAM